MNTAGLTSQAAERQPRSRVLAAAATGAGRSGRGGWWHFFQQPRSEANGAHPRTPCSLLDKDLAREPYRPWRPPADARSPHWTRHRRLLREQRENA
jgi:hypothetical protein